MDYYKAPVELYIEAKNNELFCVGELYIEDDLLKIRVESMLRKRELIIQLRYYKYESLNDITICFEASDCFESDGSYRISTLKDILKANTYRYIFSNADPSEYNIDIEKILYA